VTTLNTVIEHVSDLPCTNIASTSIEHMLAFARDLWCVNFLPWSKYWF